MRWLITGGSGFIGTRLVAEAVARGHDVRNLSDRPPSDPQHAPHWCRVDLLDAESVARAVAEFLPDVVFHLAARTDCVETTTVEESYRVNTEGVAHLLQAVKACGSVRRLVMTSSQFVCGPGYVPQHDEDYHPVTVYGRSKVVTEQLTRQAGLSCCWTLVRPTNIWGPWHPRYPREFWRVVRRGWYVHPGGAPVVRCYGYVGNVVAQMIRIVELPPEKVDRQVFYVSDPPDDIRKWAGAFSLALTGRPVRTVPRPILALLGYAGDVIGALQGRPFLISTSRVRSMTSDYAVPLERTLAELGPGPYSLEAGVRETVDWLKSHDPEFQDG